MRSLTVAAAEVAVLGRRHAAAVLADTDLLVRHPPSHAHTDSETGGVERQAAVHEAEISAPLGRSLLPVWRRHSADWMP